MPPVGETTEAGPLTTAEKALWVLGHLTQALGFAIAAVLILAHDRFSFSLIGAVIGGVLLGGLINVVGYTARRGDVGEVAILSLIALVLFLGLTMYGALILTPVDALGATCMLLLGAGAVVHSRRHVDVRTGIVWSPAASKVLGFLFLLFFLGWYLYLGLRPWLGR